MRKLIRPLVSLYRGWIFACLGAVASLPPLLVAVLSAPRGRPIAVRVAGFAVGFVLVVAVMALPRAVRRGSVRLADRLLGSHLPTPLEPPRSRRLDCLRTAAWLVVHMATGAMVTAVTGLLLFASVVLPAVWLGSAHDVTFVALTVGISHGWRGGWTLLAAAGCLVAAGYLVVAAMAVLRRLAPIFLGYGAAERLAAAEEQMTTLAQRNRLAQELHDSIGHTLTASTIQAAVALELMDRDPEGARRALGSIEETSRAAMDDLDHVLGVLRQERPSARPQPTLADVRFLNERLRHMGAELTMEIDGDLDRVPATASREAYRIIQESLTNALRHGGKTGIRLRVAVHDESLEVRLINRVRPGAALRGAAPRGHGLTGIGERVRLLREEMSAGPTDNGSQWQVIARIPLRAAP